MIRRKNVVIVFFCPQVSAAAMTQVSNLLVTLNSSVNLFIYCGFGGKFRRELKRLFCNLIPRKQVTFVVVVVAAAQTVVVDVVDVVDVVVAAA